MLIISLVLVAISYLSPVSFPISLAGNFGEPRPNHFHGGLDIKTQHEEGKPIHAVADGYVCRVTVSTTGYGNAVYVRHPDGHTTVYAHLQRFEPSIQSRVKKWQYDNRSWAADVTFQANEFPVKQGQIIALSGNTGSSMGPHLHLEVHQSDTWDMYDPLEFLSGLVNDTKAPEARAIMIYPIEGKGVVCNSVSPQRFDWHDGLLSDTIKAWGDIGIALFANDYMENSSNHYGIRYTTLYVDGVQVFHSDVNGIPVSQNRMVNSWGDFDYFEKHHEWFMKSFIEPGNVLACLSADKDKGILSIKEERIYSFRYLISDYFGNTSEYKWTIRGEKQTISKPQIRNDNAVALLWNKDCSIQRNGFSISIPKGNLPNTIYVTPEEKQGPFSKIYTIVNHPTPLFDMATVSIELTSDDKSLYPKLFIARNGKYLGGKAIAGSVVAKTKELGGAFTVLCDSLSPIIEIKDNTDNKLVVDVADTLSGIHKVAGFIDGQFILLEPQPRTSQWYCVLSKTPVRRKRMPRSLLIEAIDQRGNKANYKTTINY